MSHYCLFMRTRKGWTLLYHSIEYSEFQERYDDFCKILAEGEFTAWFFPTHFKVKVFEGSYPDFIEEESMADL